MNNNGNLAGGRALTRWMQSDAVQASLVQKIITAVNNLGRNAGVSPTGQLSSPPPPESLTVKASGGLVHAVITHNAPIQKPVNYFVEYDTSPAFTQPHVVDYGTSRTHHPFPLPANDDDGNPQSWYFRTYAQLPGSQASEKTVYGGESGAIPVSVGGAANLTLPASTGSGTASPLGTQGGQGFGNTSTRVAPAPKRSVGL